MNKEELLKLRTRLVSYGGAGIIALTSLVGCSKPIPEKTVAHSIQSEAFDLANDDSKMIITVSDKDGNKNMHFVDKNTLDNIKLYSDGEKYNKYFNANKATAKETIVYIDVFTLDVVAVKYINISNNIFGEVNKKITYYSNEIIKEEPAINYAKKYIGTSDKYTEEEIVNMVNDLRIGLTEKRYVKY